MANAEFVVSVRCETEAEREEWRRSTLAAEEQARRAMWAGVAAFILGAIAILLAVALLSGCASLGGPRHVTAVSLAATAGVLETFVTTERQLVCGQPAAPQAPRCVPVPTHLQIMSHVERAATLGAQASRVMAGLPRGTPQPAEVVTMLVQVQGLISAAYALIPQSQDKAALGQAIGVGGAK
jgi:hypothetical protein